MASRSKGLAFLVTAFAAVVLSASAAFPSGYQLNEHGSKAVAMGGAFVARAWDPSSIYFNPAGLSYVKGFALERGMSALGTPSLMGDHRPGRPLRDGTGFPGAYGERRGALDQVHREAQGGEAGGSLIPPSWLPKAPGRVGPVAGAPIRWATSADPSSRLLQS